jgi:hypothetical protein
VWGAVNRLSDACPCSTTQRGDQAGRTTAGDAP